MIKSLHITTLFTLIATLLFAHNSFAEDTKEDTKEDTSVHIVLTGSYTTIEHGGGGKKGEKKRGGKSKGKSGKFKFYPVSIPQDLYSGKYTKTAINYAVTRKFSSRQSVTGVNIHEFPSFKDAKTFYEKLSDKDKKKRFTARNIANTVIKIKKNPGLYINYQDMTPKKIEKKKKKKK